jgi:hypothetical protein
MPQLRLPRVQLPKLAMPKLSVPKVSVPPGWMQEARMLMPAVGVAAVVAGFIILNPVKSFSKIPWPSVRMPSFAKSAPEPSQAASDDQPVRATLKRVASKPKAADGETEHADEQAKADDAKAQVPAGDAEPSPKVETVQASVTPLNDPLELASPPQVALASTQPLELLVTAHRTTWIRIRADGRLLTQQRLSRGANEKWTAKKQFEIIVAKPNQVDLTLNGQSISPFAVAHKGRVLVTHRGVTNLPDDE